MSSTGVQEVDSEQVEANSSAAAALGVGAGAGDWVTSAGLW